MLEKLVADDLLFAGLVLVGVAIVQRAPVRWYPPLFNAIGWV